MADPEKGVLLTHRRNVVPLLANGARMPRTVDLPADLARLPSFNAVSVPHDYFAEAMQKLRGRFLHPPEPMPPRDMPAARLGPLRPRTLPAPALSRRRGSESPLVITLDWTSVDGAVGYALEQSASASFARSRRRNVSSRAHHDVLLTELDRSGRLFRVRAESGFGFFVDGPWSNILEVR